LDHQERAIRLIDVACFCDFLQQSLEVDQLGDDA
jgi:hypothetical protein